MTTGPIEPAAGRFPARRMRRNRTNDAVLRMMAVNSLSVDDFI